MKTIKLKDWGKEAEKAIEDIKDKKLKEIQSKPSTNNDSPSLRNPLPGRKVPKR
ncbi:hypothetical protein BDD43_2100 [Mucilaginibacter gracilis]|uniref:Uncharacterized protein n=1 Tax=Mucilaginibacter gracilis TaxID=423350 RepID=A0A495J0P7_9SPHI|nr:hypothetical protein [Mucilaginibacter gracilis]RKR81938.1 hypothetical protein BDD43_2100 [Mucilaginibacter gracilis]